jgi:hypothetical protein
MCLVSVARASGGMEFTSSDEITHSQKCARDFTRQIRTSGPPVLVLHFDFRFNVDRFC